MKRKHLLIGGLAIIFSLQACKTQEKTTDTNQNNVVLTQTSTEQDLEREKRIEDKMRAKGLSREELDQIRSFADQKATIACEIENLEKHTTEENSAKNKTKVIALEHKMKQLNTEIAAFNMTEARRKEFDRVYKIAHKKCSPL